jgi:hypothetical protein
VKKGMHTEPADGAKELLQDLVTAMSEAVLSRE